MTDTELAVPAPSASQTQASDVRSLALRAAVTAGLLGYVLWRLDLPAAVTRVRGASPLWIAAAFVAVFAAIGVSAVKWGLILRRRGHPLTYPRLLRHYFVGLFFNNVLPTTVGGDAVRAWETTKDTREVPEAVGSVVTERLIAGVSLGFTALLGLPFVARTPLLLAMVLGFLVLDVALVSAFLVPRFAEGAVRGLLRSRFPDQADAAEKTIVVVRETLKDRSLVIRVAALSVAFQVLVAVVNVCIFRSMNVPVGLGECVVYTPMIFTVTMLPVSLSGLGVREAAYWYFFAQAGVSQTDAVTASLLFFVIVAVASLPGSVFFAFNNRKQA